MVIGIKPDQISAYKALHAGANPGVRDLLTKYHMHNFSIYMHQLMMGSTTCSATTNTRAAITKAIWTNSELKPAISYGLP